MSADKKEYESPELISYGSVAKVTETTPPPPFTGADGGSFPNNYGS